MIWQILGIIYGVIAVIVWFNMIPSYRMPLGMRIERYCKCAIISILWLPALFVVAVAALWFIGKLIDTLSKIVYK